MVNQSINRLSSENPCAREITGGSYRKCSNGIAMSLSYLTLGVGNGNVYVSIKIYDIFNPFVVP